MYSRIRFDVRFCRPVVVHETPWNTKSRGNVTVRSYFILDVFVNFRTSYIDDMTNVITDNKMIAKNYILGWFAIDFVSCFPTSYILLVASEVQGKDTRDGATNFKIFKLLRLLRLMKLLRLAKVSLLPPFVFFVFCVRPPKPQRWLLLARSGAWSYSMRTYWQTSSTS